MLKNKVILVTGGTGSFGKAYISYLIKSKIKFKKIIIFSRDELKQFEMSNQKIFRDQRIRMILGDTQVPLCISLNASGPFLRSL